MKNFQLVHQGFTITAEERVTLRIKNTRPTARTVDLKGLHRIKLTDIPLRDYIM